MGVRKVIRMGHPTLRKRADDYPAEMIGGEDFLTLIEDMRETLHAYGGIGLAAPQIDVPYKIAVIEIETTDTRYGEVDQIPFSVYINPVISVINSETAGFWEGCLSVPGLRGYVERPQHIRIDYLDEKGAPGSVELKGFLATVFQHEFDHLEGKLYIDRVTDTTKLSFEEEFSEFFMVAEE